MTSSYNKLYNIWVKNENKIPATYGDVSLYSQAKADLNQITTTNLAINKNNTINDLDVSGNSYFTGRVDVSGNLYINGSQVGTGIPVDVSNNFVWKTGTINETITGVKTFSSPPECSTDATTSTQLITKNFGDANYVRRLGTITETITGIKTFTSVVRCSQTASGGTDLTNVQYGITNYGRKGSVNIWNNTNYFQSILLNKPDLGQAPTYSLDVSGNGNFEMPSAGITLTNPNFTAFTGFTAPVYPTQRTLISNANNTQTLNGWTISMGTSGTTLWSNGNNGLEFYSSPPAGYTYFLWNRSYMGSTYYLQQGSLVLPAGIYVLTFWSFWGYQSASAGGATNGKLTISALGSTDTYAYNDADTRSSLNWRQHTFRFTITSNQSAGYIRWTPSDNRPAGTPFPWAITGVVLTSYTTLRLNNPTTSLQSYLGGDINVLRNAYINNIYGTGVLTLIGIPTFTAAGSNVNCLSINSAFTTAAGAANSTSIMIGQATGQYGTTYNRMVGLGINLNDYASPPQTAGSRCVLMGSTITTARNQDILIGHFIKSTGDSTGQNVAIGCDIGVSTTDTLDGVGVGRRTIAIGCGIFSGTYNGYGLAPTQPLECVAIGYLSQRTSMDNYNTSVGSRSLQNLIGNNGTTGSGIPTAYTTQYNCALGYYAGNGQSLLNNCVFLGANTIPSANNISNATALGHGAIVGNNYATAIGSDVVNNTANSVRIGRSTDTTYIDGALVLASNKMIVNDYMVLFTNSNFICSYSDTSTLGNGNTIYGWGAYSNTATSASTYNAIFGYSSGIAITTSRNNCLMGYYAGSAITTGIANTLVGFLSGYLVTTGENNVALGPDTFNILTTGSNNTAIGRQAGRNCVTSTYCNFFGNYTTQDISGNSYINSTALGTNAQITASNQIVIGTSTETTVISGKLNQVSMLANYADNSNLSTTQTLSKPFNQYYSVNITSSITITMPEITSASELGLSITFRLNAAPSTFTMSVIRQGTSNLVVPTGSATGQSTAYVSLSSTKYKITFVALKLGTNYGWFEI